MRYLHIQQIRKIIQYLFFSLTALIGWQFATFISGLEKGFSATVYRPLGIEAFLPISSLISLKYWMLSGIMNTIHPSGLIILLIILATALILKRGFCSWICPIGLLTEHLNQIHRFIFNKDLKIPFWIDYPLRSLKYLILLFFLWAIMIKMDLNSLETFIYSPYNMIADIKMLLFFKHISLFALWVLVALVILSVLIRNFWCRYLCPYGALLGALSLMSLFKVQRNKDSCTQCKRCTKACPVNIQVHRSTYVISDECHACLKCVAICPEKNTLYISIAKKFGFLKPVGYAILICLFFLGGSIAARLTGHWRTSISNSEYAFHITHLNRPLYQHNRGQVPAYDKNAWLRMMKQIRKGDMKKGL